LLVYSIDSLDALPRQGKVLIDVSNLKYPNTSTKAGPFTEKDWKVTDDRYAPPVYEAPEVLKQTDWNDPPLATFALHLRLVYMCIVL
jgi:hypothetical protein